MIFGLFESPAKRNQKLRDAASAGDLQEVTRLLGKGADPNELEPETGNTALVLAAYRNHEPIVATLLQQGRADPNLQARSGYSPLFSAASQGDAALGCVRLLLAAGARPDLAPSTGETAGVTPLYVASTRGAIRVMQALVEAGASTEVVTDAGMTLLHAAGYGGNRSTVEQLLAWGSAVDAPNAVGVTPLIYASIAGNVEVVTALLDAGARIEATDAEGRTALMAAALNDKAFVVQLLLSRGANPDPHTIDDDGESMTPLYGAAIRGYGHVVDLLLAAGVSVLGQPTGGASLAGLARTAGHPAVAGRLEAAAKRERSQDRSVDKARKATEKLWKSIVEAFNTHADAGLGKLAADPAFGTLPLDARLLVASAIGDVAAVRALLAQGANPGTVFPEILDGMHAVYAAVGLAISAEALTALLEGGAGPDVRRTDGATSLIVAVIDKHADLARILLAHGADPDHAMPDGTTPLMIAATNGSIACIDVLLDAGAAIDTVRPDSKELGAFGIGLDRLDMATARHLLGRGATPNFGTVDTLPLALAEHAELGFIEAVAARGVQLVTDAHRARIAFVAGRNPDPEVLAWLIDQGADPADERSLRYTCLTLAALTGNVPVTRKCLARGDDPDARDVDGETALSLAIEKDHPAIVALLREAGAQRIDVDGLAPEEALQRAAAEGALGTLLDLRDQGISINLPDAQGNTPLMTAARADRLDVVRSLYHLGGDLNHHNAAGETALQIATELEHTDIADALREFGALDAVSGELGALSSMLGGLRVFNGASTMFGRMSHPYKDRPPYEPADEEDEASDEPEEEDRTASRLDLLGHLLDSDELASALPEAVIGQLRQMHAHWQGLHEAGEFGDGELAQLNGLLGKLGFPDEASTDDEESETQAPASPLRQAVQSGDLAAVRKLIKSGADVDEVDAEGTPLLVAAVFTDEPKLVDGLLKLGADVNQNRPDGLGALSVAALKGNAKVCQILLEAGADLEAPARFTHNGHPVEGCTPLYLTALLGSTAAAKVLIAAGAVVDAPNAIGFTPLMAAVNSGHGDFVDLLLEHGADPNAVFEDQLQIDGLGSSPPLYIAARKEDVSMVRKLIKRGANVDLGARNGWTPLKSVAQQGNEELVRILLAAGADPNIPDASGYTALMNAAGGGHERIVKMLLDKGADPNLQCGEIPEGAEEDQDWQVGRSALMEAAGSGNVAVAKLLLKHGANPDLKNDQGRTALHSAVFAGSPRMVRLLLEAGASPDVYGSDEEQRSALDLAVQRWVVADEDERGGDLDELVRLLAKKGRPKDLSSLNETAVEIVEAGRPEVLELLRKHGIRIDVDDAPQGASRLFALAMAGDHLADGARALLAAGANPNFRTPAGMTVLHAAVRMNAPEMAELLVEAGADLLSRNDYGLLPVDLAAIYGYQELAQQLIGQMNARGTEVDQQDAEGNTALMRAVQTGDLEPVRALIRQGADLGRRNLLGETPLSHAVCHDRVEIVRALRDAGAESPAEAAGMPLVEAASRGALGRVLDLLDAGDPVDTVDENRDTALTAAQVLPGIQRVLAWRGANLTHRNAEGKSAYQIAASAKRTLVMETLAELGAPVEEAGELDQTTRMKEEIHNLTAVTGSGGHDDEDTGESLRLAAVLGNPLAVDRAIEAGVDVDEEDDEGRTALIIALAMLGRGEASRQQQRNFEQVIDALLRAGADPNRGCTASLPLAAMTRRLHLVNALLRAGADLNATSEVPTSAEGDDTTTVNALMLALSRQDDEPDDDERIALALIEAGIDLEFESDNGSKAIHWAAQDGRVRSLAAMLKRAPALADARDADGKTAVMVAEEAGMREAVLALAM